MNLERVRREAVYWAIAGGEEVFQIVKICQDIAQISATQSTLRILRLVETR